MTYNDVEVIYNALQGIAVDKEGKERDLKVKFKVSILKIVNALDPEIKTITKIRNELYQKYGEPVGEDQIQVKEENKDLFFKDIADLYSTKSDIVLPTKFNEDEFIDVCDKNGIPLSFKDIEFCQKFLFE